MDFQRRENIRHSLRSLAEAYKSNMELMQRTFALLEEELSVDPFAYYQSKTVPRHPPGGDPLPLVDRGRFSVHFQGKSCFLGNQLPFLLLERLARRPNTYVSYENLTADVWRARVSDAAVRSVVKILRHKLRRAGLRTIADAIDGSSFRHYALRLDSLG